MITLRKRNKGFGELQLLPNTIAVDWLNFLSLGFLLFLWCHVGLDKELSEEEEKRQNVRNICCRNLS